LYEQLEDLLELYASEWTGVDKAFEQARQMEKEQQKSEQIELIKWIQDSLKAKEFYVTYDAEELLEKFKTK
jgi:hypothetical protein